MLGAFFGGTKAMAKDLTSIPVEVNQGLPLADRGIAWTRTVIRNKERIDYSQNSIQSPTNFQASQALKSLEHHTRASHAWEQIPKKSSGPGFWWSNPHQEISAVLGRLLYPEKTSRPENLAEITRHRVFSTDLPSIFRSIETQELKMSIKEELYIRLTAATKSTPEGSESAKLPDLELRFRTLLFDARQQRKVVLEEVRLILEKKQADLLLPHEPGDLRYEVETYINGKDEPDPHIREFVKSCTLDATEIDQIKTPQVLTIGIPPQFLFPGSDSQSVDGSEILIAYSPTGIERRYSLQHRPGLNARTRQSDLSFSTVDAGLIGGRRQEVRFFDDRPLKIGPEQVTEKGVRQQKKASIVKALYKSAIDIINNLRTEPRREPKPVSTKTLRRMRRVIQGHRGTRLGQKSLIERVRGPVPRGGDGRRLNLHAVVRRKMTDPDRPSIRARDAARERIGRRSRVRKVYAADTAASEEMRVRKVYAADTAVSEEMRVRKVYAADTAASEEGRHSLSET